MNTKDLAQTIICDLIAEGTIKDGSHAMVLKAMIEGRIDQYNLALYNAAVDMTRANGDYNIQREDLAILLGCEE